MTHAVRDAGAQRKARGFTAGSARFIRGPIEAYSSATYGIRPMNRARRIASRTAL